VDGIFPAILMHFAEVLAESEGYKLLRSGRDVQNTFDEAIRPAMNDPDAEVSGDMVLRRLHFRAAMDLSSNFLKYTGDIAGSDRDSVTFEREERGRELHRPRIQERAQEGRLLGP
jgi:hypothetical protein